MNRTMDAATRARFWTAYVASEGFHAHLEEVEGRIRANLMFPPSTDESADYRLGFLAGLQAAMALPKTLADAATREQRTQGATTGGKKDG